MDSADAAPPPKAPPLPSEAPNSSKSTAPICNAKPAVSPHESTATAATPVSPTTSTALPSNTTTTKKRPLAATHHASDASKPAGTGVAIAKATAPTLIVPALKSKNKKTPLKAKKSLKKKKKKRFSSILSGMMKPKKEIDVQAEREAIRKSLGGGNFIKVDKI